MGHAEEDKMWRFAVLLAILFAFGVNANPAIAAKGKKFNYGACIAPKIVALRSVTKGNAAGLVKIHFSIDSLAAIVVGGGLKWKNSPPERKQAIRGLFSNPEIIGELYDNLKENRNATLNRVRPSSAKTQHVVPINVTASGRNQNITLKFIVGSCRLGDLCKGSRCVSTIFTFYRPKAE